MTEETGQAGGTAERAALRRLLGGPELSWLVERVRARVLTAGGEPLTGVVQLRTPTDAQRAAVTRLVGRSRRAGDALRVDLGFVEQILRRGPWPAGLADAVVELTGPVVDRRAERASEAAAWGFACDRLSAATARFPALAGWWEPWCAAGGLKRSARAEAARLSCEASPVLAVRLVEDVAAVLDVLPASGEPVAVLARRVLGDAHGLDPSRPLGRLAASVVGVAFTAEEAGADREPSGREAWAVAGVVLSNVASTVLSWGVPGGGTGDQIATGTSRAATATATALEAMRVARVPLVLTLDQVRSGGVQALPPHGTVHVCENPTVVEVAAERWARATISTPHPDGVGPVLVCTWGQPSTAVVELLVGLTAQGARCRYHGDFDWAGLRIARSLGTHVPWTPWRFGAEDYLAAVEADHPARTLTGVAAPSPWDPDLAMLMEQRGLVVEEEAVADLLVDDLLGEWS